MENITHSLLGATLAEAMLPPGAEPRQRRLFYIAGIVAANLPDADLLYTRITPPPLGYLLHHRGHTHTLVGAAGLALLIWLVTLIPSVRRVVTESPGRFWSLITFALLSHIVADSWNSYGVHPFWPLDNRWFYGDSIFILEPWLWTILGVFAAANAQSRAGRLLLSALVIVLPVALVGVRMMGLGSLVALAVAGAVLVWLATRLTPQRRAVTALALAAVFVMKMFGLNRVAHNAAIASRPIATTGEILDLVLNPKAGAPLCWDVLSIEKHEAAGEYSLQRGEIALFAGWLPWRACPMSGSPVGASRSIATWSAAQREPLAPLRMLAYNDCWVRAWLQFGRAPQLADGGISDARFGGVARGNFTTMSLLPPEQARVCPPHLTNWDMPRTDLMPPGSEN